MSVVYGHNKGIIPLGFDMSPAIRSDLLLPVRNIVLLYKGKACKKLAYTYRTAVFEKTWLDGFRKIFHLWIFCKSRMLYRVVFRSVAFLFLTLMIHNFLRIYFRS